MSDEPDPNIAKDRYDITRVIVITSCVITLIMSMVIISTSLIMIFNGHDVPSPLKEWTGIAIGYMFTNLWGGINNFINKS